MPVSSGRRAARSSARVRPARPGSIYLCLAPEPGWAMATDSSSIEVVVLALNSLARYICTDSVWGRGECSLSERHDFRFCIQ